MDFSAKQQIEEALGNDNKWFCSQTYARSVDDQELLMTHYIRHGGAKNFRQRYNQAMGDENRWYCSQYYGYQVTDPRMLWDYYVKHSRPASARDPK